MAGHIRDRYVGLVFIVIALIWTAIVYRTIPSISGDGEYGPRAFPLIFGVVLCLSALLLVVFSFFGKADDDNIGQEPTLDKAEIFGVLSTFFLIVGYGFTMELVGFVVATPILVAIILVFLLGVRSITFILVFALGLTAGTYIVFSRFLGAYLPPGTWITLL